MDLTDMLKVVIYTTNYCPYCHGAKALLRSKNVDFVEIDVTDDPARRAEMERLSARRTVPQIFIDGHSVGGFDDVRRLDAAGELDRLLGRPDVKC
jgi:glutaredoxin 3